MGSTVTISFNGVQVATTQAYGFAHLIYAKITVPSVDYGTYQITASNTVGDSATASFTVAASAPSPTETPPPEEGTPTNPPEYTYKPTKSPGVESAGFWSPLVIAVVGVVAAFAVITPVALVLRSRSSKRETLLEKEHLPYRSEPYAQPNQPTPPYGSSTSRYSPSTTSRYTPPSSRYSSSSTPYSPSSSPYNPSSTYQSSTYGQYSTRSTVTNRYSQPSSNVQQPSFGKTCHHCKRIVKEDYNICPYCNKRMR